MTTEPSGVPGSTFLLRLARPLISLGLALLYGAPAAGQPAVVGSWAPPVSLEVEGVHGAVLPNGKVLYV
ncbi:MAG: hypothetical protein AAF725_24910, partial [Acidobacteriota bacterium]